MSELTDDELKVAGTYLEDIVEENNRKIEEVDNKILQGLVKHKLNYMIKMAEESDFSADGDITMAVFYKLNELTDLIGEVSDFSADGDITMAVFYKLNELTDLIGEVDADNSPIE